MSQKSNIISHLKGLPYNVKQIISEFKKPILENVFFQNLDALLNDSESVTFSNNKWTMRPEKFCLDHYEEPYIYPVILLVNNVKSFFEFRSEYLPDEVIIAPSRAVISKITGYIKD